MLCWEHCLLEMTLEQGTSWEGKNNANNLYYSKNNKAFLYKTVLPNHTKTAEQNLTRLSGNVNNCIVTVTTQNNCILHIYSATIQPYACLLYTSRCV